MVSARKQSREAKNCEISNSEGKSNSEKSGPSESAGLRRSSRETMVKKSSGLSPTSKRKSDRTEHHSPAKPPEEARARKSSANPSPLRRSDRGKTSSSSDIPSSSKKHKLVPNPLLEVSRMDQKEKSVMQLNLETKKVDAKPVKVGKKKGRKRMTCRAYVAMLNGKSPAGLSKKPEGADKLLDEDNIASSAIESDCDDQSSTVVASVHKNAEETSLQNVVKTESEKEATSTTYSGKRGRNGSRRSPKPPTGQSICFKCNLGGELLSCEGRRCKKSYHLSCLDPPLDDVPLGVWHCLDCVKKKLESGVHSVSDGVELIWDAKEVNVLDVGGMRKDKEFLVKYKGLAHIHNRWIPESKLQLEAPSLVAKFNRKNQASSWKHEWTIPHRLLQKRLLMSPEQHDLYLTERAEKKIDSKYEWLVKWKGLDYEHATWELDNAVLFKSPDGSRLIEDYENRHKRVTGASSSKVDKVLDGDHDFIDKLHEFWRKDQNAAAVIDDQSNERFVKVISLVQSFQSNNSRPVLIISTSATLNLWELEFVQGAPNLNVVVYSGNKDLRKIVRKLDFYSEGDSIMFQVLVTTLDIVLEDLEILRKIKWESIIIDEQQRTKVSSHCAEVKLLEANRRLLILSCQLKENVAEYHSLLCLLESLKDSPNSNSVSLGDNIVSLMDKVSKYIAYRCKPDSSKFREYWVPIEMANLQVEQYCATFISNAAILCGSHKNNCVAGLRDVIVSSRKCCDHPYIVDENTPGYLSGKGLPASENLNFGINESGKFQFLDMMLSEFKKQGLRAVILFQELGKDAVGNFLEDFMRQRFGPDSFERIVAGIQASKKYAALNKFNDKSSQFVFLMETRACQPSIKLSSVNAVIIFGSDWNPMNDMRALQRVTLDSSSEQIPVFRLFLSHTLEEKILSLAKQEKCVEYSVQHMAWNTTHMLLVWGASHQFKSLEDFHREAAKNSSAYSLSNYSSLGVASKRIRSSSLEHAILEVLQIASNIREIKLKNSSVIISVQKVGGRYRTESSLPGELKNQVVDEGQPHIFWAKLLDGKQPQWKFISGSTQRNRKRLPYSEKEAVTEEASKKRRKVVNNVELPSQELESAGMTPSYTEGANGTQSSFRSPTPKTVPVNCVQSNNLETEERRKLREAQKGLHVFLKPGILELCKILKLPDNSESLVEEFLEYMMSYHNVNTDSPTTKQAFQISLIWTVASIQDLKIDHKQSLDLARQRLDFKCRKEESEFAYSMLRCFKTIFAYRTGRQSLSSLGLSRCVKNDVLKCVIQIKKKSQKKLQKLIKQLEDEKETIMRDHEANKLKTQNHLRMESIIIRACCEDNSSMRIDKLKQAEASSANELEELENMRNLRLKKLESREITARKAIQDKESRCLGAVKSWVCPELFDKRFENGSFDLLELLQNGEEVVIAQDDSNNECVAGVSFSPPENRSAKTTTEGEPSRVSGAKSANDGAVGAGSLSQLPSREQFQDPATISLPNVEISAVVPQPSHREVEVVHTTEEDLEICASALINSVGLDRRESWGPLQESCMAKSSSALVQRTVAITTDSAVPPNQTCQNECPVSSASDGIQLKDSQAGDQPSASVSQPLDSAPPVNQSVLEATITKTAPQERVLPSSQCLDSAPVNHSVPEATVSEPAPQDRALPSSQPLDSAPVNQSALEASISEFTPQECVLTSFHPLSGENLASDQVSQLLVSQSVQDATVSEPTLQVHAVASSNPLPSDNSVGAPLSVDIQRQPCSENRASIQVSPVPPVPIHPVLPPVPVSSPLSSGLPAGLPERQISGSRTMIAPETNNLYAQRVPASMIFPGLPTQATPMHVDPLHKMVEGLSKEFEFAHKRNEDESLQLKSEYEKEIEEAVTKIKEKYELKHREKEARFVSLKNVYEQRSAMLQQNWCLGETFYTKCTEPGMLSSKSGTQQDLPINVVHQMAHSQMMQRNRQQRPPLVATPSRRLQTYPPQQNPCATYSMPITPPPVQTTGPPPGHAPANPGPAAPPPMQSNVPTARPSMVGRSNTPLLVRSTIPAAGPAMLGRSNIPPSVQIPVSNVGPVVNIRSNASPLPPIVRSIVPPSAPLTGSRGNNPPVLQAVVRPPPQVSSVSYTNTARQVSPQMSSRPPHLRSSLSPLPLAGITPPHLRGISTPGPAVSSLPGPTRGPHDISPNLVSSVEPNLNRGRDSVSDWLVGQLNVSGSNGTAGTRVNRGPTYGQVDGQLNASGTNGTAGTRVNLGSTSGQVNIVCLSDDD